MSSQVRVLRVTDRLDPRCYLSVLVSDDKETAIHGWNEHIDGFAGIDLGPEEVAELIEFLTENSLT
jgi:hypothetical protein